jgi:ribose/xylose/arabinose/galactoside ABC-type transport system permease subunit
MLGTLVGTLVIVVLTDLLVLVNVGENGEDVIYGFVILTMLLVSRGVDRRQSRL